MSRSSKLRKVMVLAVAVALCATTIAIANGTSVAPRIDLPKSKQAITYGQASPFTVKAVGGSFEGTLTVEKSIVSSATGFAAILSTRTISGALGVNPGKLNQNTWFRASYVPSGTVEATTSPVVMIGVMAKLGPVSHRAPKRVGRDTIGVSGSVEVTPTAETTPHVDVVLQKLVGKTTVKVIKGEKVRFWKWQWVTITSEEATLTKVAKKDAYTYKTDFGTKAIYKGMTVRVVVSYEDAVHVKATRYGNRLIIR